MPHMRIVDDSFAEMFTLNPETGYMTEQVEDALGLRYLNVNSIVNDNGIWNGQVYITDGLSDPIISKMMLLLRSCHQRRDDLVMVHVEDANRATYSGIFVPMKPSGLNDHQRCVPRRLATGVRRTISKGRAIEARQRSRKQRRVAIGVAAS